MGTRRNKPKTLPHEGVFVRLQRSPLHGVGVFAIRKIKRGTFIFPDDEGQLVWIQKIHLKSLPKAIRRLYEDFCVIEDGGKMYGCPKSFNHLTVSWYLNESDHPNVGCNASYDFYALRDIRRGEELTVDYSTYNDFGKKR